MQVLTDQIAIEHWWQRYVVRAGADALALGLDQKLTEQVARIFYLSANQSIAEETVFLVLNLLTEHYGFENVRGCMLVAQSIIKDYYQSCPNKPSNWNPAIVY